jgi:hypothetical protein
LPQVQNKEEESVIFMGVFFSHEKSWCAMFVYAVFTWNAFAFIIWGELMDYLRVFFLTWGELMGPWKPLSSIAANTICSMLVLAARTWGKLLWYRGCFTSRWTATVRGASCASLCMRGCTLTYSLAWVQKRCRHEIVCQARRQFGRTVWIIVTTIRVTGTSHLGQRHTSAIWRNSVIVITLNLSLYCWSLEGCGCTCAQSKIE